MKAFVDFQLPIADWRVGQAHKLAIGNWQLEI